MPDEQFLPPGAEDSDENDVIPDHVSYLAMYAAAYQGEQRTRIRESLPENQHEAFDWAVAVHDDRAADSAGKRRAALANEAYGKLQARDDAARMRQEELAAERGHVASRILTYQQLRDLPRPDQLIWNVCYSGSVGVVLGDSQTGKTWVMLSIAAAAAQGVHWPVAPKDPGIGRPTPIPVLYVAAEDGGSIGARLENWEKAHDRDLNAGAVFHTHPLAINVLDDVQIDQLCDAVKSSGYRLVILDTVAASLGGEEEGNPQFSKMVQNMRRVVAAMNGEGSVFLVHHFGKDKTKGARGGSSLFNDADIVWELTGNLDAMAMTCKKWKADSVRRPWHLRLDRADKSAVHITASDPSSGSVNIASDPHTILEDSIFKAVREYADENQGYGPSGSTISGYLRKSSVQFRETAYRDALAIMVSDGRLFRQKGPRNAMWYRLPPVQGTIPTP